MSNGEGEDGNGEIAKSGASGVVVTSKDEIEMDKGGEWRRVVPAIDY